MKTVAEWTHAWAERAKLPSRLEHETASTNTTAKEERIPAPFLLIAEHQTAGRGRGGNVWIDIKPGTSLLSSWIFELERPVQPISSPLVGLALYRSCTRVWPDLKWSLKAPNDLYLEDRKVAGLLLETVSTGDCHRFIVGLGFNVFSHPEDGPRWVPGIRAGHLAERTDRPPLVDDWNHFLDAWWADLNHVLPRISSSTLSGEATDELLAALNRYPKLSKSYDAVAADGSLRQGATIIPWTSL